MINSKESNKISRTDFWKDLCVVISFIVIILLIVFFSQVKLSKPREIITKIPKIGILTKPLLEENYSFKTNKTQAIEAKYARFIEGAGGIPLFINYNSSEDELREIFEKINGLFLIGGAPELNEFNKQENTYKLTLYGQKIQFMIELAKEAYDLNNNYFPIWGTCLGYEAILLAISKNYGLLKSGCTFEKI